MAGKINRKDNKSKTPYSKIATGSVISTALFFLFIGLFALMALNSGVSASLYMPTGMIFGAITAFLGGFISVRPLKEKGVLFGAISGVIQAVICAAVLFFINKGSVGTGVFILSALIIVFSGLGGIAAVNLKIKKKY